jgi:hypothetical protein
MISLHLVDICGALIVNFNVRLLTEELSQKEIEQKKMFGTALSRYSN